MSTPRRGSGDPAPCRRRPPAPPRGRHHDKNAHRAGEETAFCSEAYYDERDIDAHHWHESWLEFERAIRTKPASSDTMPAHFRLHRHRRRRRDLARRRSIPCHRHRSRARIKTLHRARVFQSENASGISVFYGATRPETAIAEVRPPVKSYVAVARFEIIRPLRILTLGNLAFASAPGGIFDEAHAATAEGRLPPSSQQLPLRARRARSPTRRLSPLPSRRRLPRHRKRAALDGVAYPTTQISASGNNVALFHKASRVEELHPPHGSAIEATGPIDAEGLYTGFEITQLPSSDPQEAARAQRTEDLPSWEHTDQRDPALRIDVQSIEVREVTSVEVSTRAHRITRRRSPF